MSGTDQRLECDPYRLKEALHMAGLTLDDFFPSDFLKADDLNGQPHQVTMSHVEAQDMGGQTKPILHFVNSQKSLVLNKTNALVIANAYSTNMDRWQGKLVELYPDKVQFKGELVNAIRVRVPNQMVQNAAPLAHKPAEPAKTGMTSATQDFNDDIPF